MLILAFVLIALALTLLVISAIQRRSAGLPGGKIIYADTSKWRPVDDPIFDSHVGLTGKPDYLVRKGDSIIPVEVKSSHIGGSPYDSHIYQLAAYCLLVHRSYGIRPSHGILHYTNRTYRIDYTSELESALLDLLIEMRAREGRSSIPRSHQAPQRCSRCGYRSICDQRL